MQSAPSMPGEILSTEPVVTSAGMGLGAGDELQQQSNNVSTLTIVCGYLFLMLANTLFQGLLTLHTLLDNPFGSHPLKFALRSETTDLVSSCP